MEVPPKINFDAPEPPRKTFSHQAAKLSLAAPVIAILINIVWRAGQSPGTANRTSSLIIGSTATVLIVAGLIAAIIALRGISSHGRKGLLGRGLGGLIINGTFIGLFFFGVAKGFNRARQSNQQAAALAAATKELAADLRQAFDPEQGITNMSTEALKTYHTKLQSLSAQTTGVEGQLLQAISAYTAKMELAARNYSRAVTIFEQGEVLNFGTLKETNVLATRKDVVVRFQVANEDYRQTVSNQVEIVESELQSRQLPPEKVQDFLAGFRKSSAPIRARALLIRDCDDRYCKAILGVLDLAEEHWERWRFDPADETVTFEDAQAHEAFSRLLEDITAISTEQIRLQGEVFELQRKVMDRR